MQNDFKNSLNEYIKTAKDALAIKPNGFFGNWAFYQIKRREFEQIWQEARERARAGNDDSME